MYKLIIVSLFFLFRGCSSYPTVVKEAEGKIPVYVTPEEALISYSLEPQPIRYLSKIYYKEPYIFALENSSGIHVIDNTDPATPDKIAFIRISGVNDMSIAETILYVDHQTDLVALDISDIHNVKEVSRQKDVFAYYQKDAPPDYHGYFECPDPEKGVIIDWIDGTIKNPDCYSRLYEDY